MTRSALVGGIHASARRLFVLAEYVNMVTVSAMASKLSLGAPHTPWPLSDGRPIVAGAVVHRQADGVLFVFVWLRGTLASTDPDCRRTKDPG
jgi:NADH:ubiquinone oxidoreductase subunit H